jgi:serine/threonine protein phosphatase PrpC
MTKMAYHVELQFAARTDTGLIREHNEDSIEFSSANGLAILADGMGGYNAGEVASSIATAIVKESIEGRLLSFGWNMRSYRAKHLQQLLVEAVEHANIAIYETARSEPQFAGMGTTLVVTLFHQDKVMVAHVGDSRAYRVRQGTLVQITRDHSLLQEQIDAGLVDPELARFSPNKNLVTRAVGVSDGVEIEIHEHVTEVGDIYLLCSDGLSDMLSTEEIVGIMTGTDSSLETTCDTLIQRANDNGGRDNTSVILIKVQAIDGETKGLFGQFLKLIQ